MCVERWMDMDGYGWTFVALQLAGQMVPGKVYLHGPRMGNLGVGLPL